MPLARFRGRSLALLLVHALLLLPLAAACDLDGDDDLPAPTPPTSEVVAFPTRDGLTIDGRLFPADPERLVILLHMYPADQAAWLGTAQLLAERGYSALTFDFRGYGASGGENAGENIDVDTRAAIEFATERGYDDLVLVGASMGGTAAIAVTAEGAPAVDGVVALSAPVAFRDIEAEEAVDDLDVPLMLIAAEGDTGAAEALEVLAEKAGVPPERAVLVEGEAHGTDLLATRVAVQVQATILQFLETVWPAEAAGAEPAARPR